jgi:hypothetical protein
MDHSNAFFDLGRRSSPAISLFETLKAAKTKSAPSVPSIEENDWDLLEELVEQLEVFYDMTTMISGQHYTTFSAIVPLYNLAKSHLQAFKESLEGNTVLSSQHISDLSVGIDDALEKLDSYDCVKSDYAFAAVVLDPRLNWNYFKESEKDLVTKKLQKMLENYEVGN